MNIGSQIKQRRVELNLTQEQVAEKIFVSVKSISNWENSKNFPDIESLIRLAKLYELSLDDLLLEDSAIVKDIQEKTRLHDMEIRSRIASVINWTLIFISFYISLWKKELANSPLTIGLLVITILNAWNIIWYSRKINKLKKIEPLKKQLQNTDKKQKLFIYILLVTVVMVATVAIFLGLYFKK